ncbi:MULTISPECIES: hypothetical protein [Bacillus]|jgi:hypothetical protein|uniref:Uncharacterized protein n=8 Tax=Bacillus cereus group TaxID=86661 RepID=Q81HB6_BACCR|nr:MULTISPECIES: hypothetical protein [Bacillus]MBJ3789669.1 hypothetical protein [Bacillus sp. OA1]MCO4217281.1 hypothetical protein [Bacillus sp. 10017]MCU7388266.1 hypothetical protein [Bacillus sp. ST24]MDJ0283754.1 hypothetical protein [Bacillus bombysepticus]MDV8111660.1 hypothetical protein [Bacillus sp. BAU-SS-2023]QQP80445.1 hypothetical protein JI729_03585 [Bacillus sp. TK-2]CJD07550.1 Uncharacterised protein [Streptococcus pneumoniae]HCF33019.1 hypothetical protein [Bacillus sp. 
MNISKKYIHIALIWFLASLFCLQISYAIHTTTSITIGWILTAIFFIISFIATRKHSVTQ